MKALRALRWGKSIDTAGIAYLATAGTGDAEEPEGILLGSNQYHKAVVASWAIGSRQVSKWQMIVNGTVPPLF